VGERLFAAAFLKGACRGSAKEKTVEGTQGQKARESHEDAEGELGGVPAVQTAQTAASGLYSVWVL
jgi:hypothetical protein